MSIFDANILIAIVTKILSPIFPNKIQTHLLRYIFRQFLVYDYSLSNVYYVKHGGESKPIDDAKLARIETYIIDVIKDEKVN